MNYYENQLKKLVKKSEYPKSVKIFDGAGNQTNQIDLNIESIPVLIKYLQEQLKMEVLK